MMLLGLIAALAALFALGHATLTLIAPEAPLWWFERAAFSLVLGVGGGSFAWAALIPLYGFLEPRLAVLIVIAIVVAAAARRGRVPFSSRLLGRRHPKPFSDPIIIVCSIVIAAQFAALTVAAIHEPLGWDGLFNQELKARLMFEHLPQGQLPIAYFSDVSRAWSHPGYPLAVPWAEFWIYSWLGRIDQHAVKILFPLYFFALIAAVCGALRRTTNARTAFVSAAAFACALPVLVDIGTTGYADVPLASAFAAALSCVMLAMNTRRPGVFVLAGTFAAIAAWTKVEGLVLATYLGVAVLVVGRGVPLWARSAVLWLPLVAMTPWFVLQSLFGMPSADFPSFLPSIAVAHVHRLPGIVALVLRALLTPGRWGLLWPAFGLACAVMLWRRDADREGLVLSGAVVVPLAVYTLIYLFSSWSDVGEHIHTSFDRLLTPLASAALIFTVSRTWLSFT